jgi:hypothetical protein
VHRTSRPCTSKRDRCAFSETEGNDSGHMMQHLESYQFYNNVSVEMAASELLRMLQPDNYRGGCFNSCQDRPNALMCSKNMLKNSDT